MNAKRSAELKPWGARRFPSPWWGAIALAVCSCGGAPVPTIEETQFPPGWIDLAHSTRTADGTYFRDLQVGDGPMAKNGQTLVVVYTGFLADGTQFDSNVDSAAVAFTLGAHQLMEGWDQGLVGVQHHTVRQLVIPPAATGGILRCCVPRPPTDVVLVFQVVVEAVQ
jgi:FKBP-type peptidyl-prolyl cis-trans isomerase FkpA